jgi:hypothetical protein
MDWQTLQRIGMGLAGSAVLLTMSGGLPGAEAAAVGKQKPAASYSLEFRSRDSEAVGHSYVVARQKSANGRVVAQRVAGFRPANIRTSVSTTIRGVAGAVGTYREDYSKRPTLSYTVNVTAGQYRRAMAKIAEVERKPPTFRALSQNCNTFLGDVAKAARLSAPSGNADRPESYVSDLRELNNGDRSTGHKASRLR